MAAPNTLLRSLGCRGEAKGGGNHGEKATRRSTSLNDPQKTTKLFSFGQPKEEKLKSHHHPQREATTPT
ncbi:hypothetical protein Taro_016867 [Colocasia esculenta]|uniref:Uncharacterized protein n=1 Tax=Colocasia esculenta TaxID=4460 RepID=A0A843UPP2_COLES|nr:hypothetical protein [Colocasia esculenta]